MPSVVTAIAMALSIAVLAAAWPADAGNQLLRLMLLVLLGMVTYGGISLFTQRALMKELFRSISNK
jgi:sugar phosphate permease